MPVGYRPASYWAFENENPLKRKDDWEEFAKDKTAMELRGEVQRTLGGLTGSREFLSTNDVKNMILFGGRIEEVGSDEEKRSKSEVEEEAEESPTLVESELEDYVDTDMEDQEEEDDEGDHEDEGMDEKWEWFQEASGMSAEDLEWARGLAEGKGLAQLWEEDRGDEDGSEGYEYDQEGDLNMDDMGGEED
ncbi:hypothetical protein TWF694_003110 [Orbilia ellipsospora]|uniref:Uncharacterized protein n=1 Tax=Orbilia ellipsospora TaxID=2528407 RepID=A0AAV9X1W4_9PEZI